MWRSLKPVATRRGIGRRGRVPHCDVAGLAPVQVGHQQEPEEQSRSDARRATFGTPVAARPNDMAIATYVRSSFVAAALAGGCMGIIGPGDDPRTGAAAGGEGAGRATDLPCEVQSLLARRCQSCHSRMPPGPLLSRADLYASSRSEPSKSTAAVALERLALSTALRMPPNPLEAATGQEIAAFRAWVEQGMPEGDCSQAVDAGTDPYDTPVVCSSETRWRGGNEESPLMRPGGACIRCHDEEGEGPRFVFAGTVYPTAHEPDDCYGVGSQTGAEVVVIDAAGIETRLPVNASGNFYLEESTIQLPYRARVEYAGRTRVMVEAQTDGDCNGCHTEAGAENAPGRVFLP